MTDQAHKMEEIKKEIRSLLLSAPVGLTLEELKQDYVKFIGKKLPYKGIGYCTLEEFIQDIPDTVQITWSNGKMILTAICNASTNHIKKLVSNQKIDSRRRWGVLEQNRSSLSLPSAGKSWKGSASSGGGSKGSQLSPLYRQYQPQGQSTQARSRVLPSVPAYVRRQISDLMQHYSDGLPLTHFNIIFRNWFGVPLDPVSMGFADEYELLVSLRDIIVLKTFSNGEDRVLSVKAAMSFNELQRHQRSGTKIHNLNKTGDQVLPVYNGPVATNICQPQSKNVRSAGKISDAAVLTAPVHEASACLDESSNVSLGVQNQMRQLLAKRPKGIYASHLPFDYKEMFKKELPTKTYGYNSVIEFVSDLPHIIRIERPNPQGDWCLFPVDVNSPALEPSCSSTVETTCLKRVVDPTTKETVLQVLSLHPTGVPLNTFLDTYQTMTGKPLDFNKWGCRSLKPFLHKLSDILYISLDSSDNAMVCSKMTHGPRKFNKLLSEYQPMSYCGDDTQEVILHLPSDAVLPGCYFKRQIVPSHSLEQYIDMYVCYIISPGLFWIQLRAQHTSLALEDLMDDLEAFYERKVSTDYSMTSVLAKRGMLCAAIFPEDGFWYRAIIIGLKEQLVEVFYVDYGNTYWLSIDQLRILKTKFMKLPAQAIQARLSNIQPLDGVWTIGARDRMLALSRERPVCGIITHVKDGVLFLCLVDTTGADDIHINDTLIEEDYATFVPDIQTLEIAQHAQAPSLGFLFGVSDVDQPESMAPSRRYVRQVQVAEDVTMDVINVDGELYLLSQEISSLFFKEDVISAKLRNDNIDVAKMVLSRAEHPDLFLELIMYKAPGVTKETRFLSVFSLSSLPLMIDLYGEEHKLEAVKESVQKIFQGFDAEDPYWRGEDEASSTKDKEPVNDASDLPSVENLKLAVTTLEMKRKELQVCTSANVSQLNEVELNLRRVHNLMATLANQSKHSGSSHSSQCDVRESTPSQLHSSICKVSSIDNDAIGLQTSHSGVGRQKPQQVKPTVLQESPLNSLGAAPVASVPSRQGLGLDVYSQLQTQVLAHLLEAD